MTNSGNEAREARILDAAAELFVHYGYDKTTVNDIAGAAGVSKGTIYLHFDSKDSMLEAVIVRELKRYAEKWLELVEADPQGGTIAGLYKNSLYALSDSAFMAALFRRDGRVLGNYLRKPNNFFRALREGQKESGRYIFVKMMQEAGAVRQDLDARVIAHIMNMLAFGLVGMDEIVPRADIPSLEELIEGIAVIMEKALMPESAPDAISEIGKQIVRQLADAGRLQYEMIKDAEQG